ncbi:MAG: zinc finger Ran-binding domain-containing family 2 protein [Chloracidobacterium sp.]|nr:zinc finger Ran-binding domain-containing family 2 protein [Chloracidobacterium sp.]
MNKKCPACNVVNFPEADLCIRCNASLEASGHKRGTTGSRLLTRIVVCIAVCCAVIFGFYVSLVASAKSLSPEQGHQVRKALAVLNERGFSNEIFLLEHFSVFRSEDNWLNASVDKENAYAAANFPFEIVTLYPDFFTYPVDDVERAAILLHESRHLRGEDEHDAYKYVWLHRKQLGWTVDKYRDSPVWSNIRKQTKDNVPELFVCEGKELSDCTE